VNGVWAVSETHYYYLTRLQVAQATSSSQHTYFKPQLSNIETVYATSTTFTMSAYGTYYYSLPTEAPKRSRSGSRRPALSPSTVSSPCITTHAPIASRRDSAGSATSSGSPTKASVLLAKVASSPTTPRSEIPSPMVSPQSSYSTGRPVVWRSESDRYVTQYRQQDGYISFPDYEKFCQTQYQYDQRHTAVRT
jgi:hypothetical protein